MDNIYKIEFCIFYKNHYFNVTCSSHIVGNNIGTSKIRSKEITVWKFSMS